MQGGNDGTGGLPPTKAVRLEDLQQTILELEKKSLEQVGTGAAGSGLLGQVAGQTSQGKEGIEEPLIVSLLTCLRDDRRSFGHPTVRYQATMRDSCLDIG